MKRVKVLIPFIDKVTGKKHGVDDIIEISDERLTEIKAVNVNMVLLLDEVEEDPKAKKQKAKATK